MNIKHDRSYIDGDEEDFVLHGFAEEDLHSVRIQFEYTEEQMEQNRTLAEKCSREQWSAYCDSAALEKSAYVFPVMEAIAKEFVCYQYADNETAKFNSEKWDLFFWCNDFYNTTCGSLAGRDYSYITLTFNDLHTVAQHLEICNRLLQFLVSRFVDYENLNVIVQHKVRYLDEKIDQTAQDLAKNLNGKKCNYHYMAGKIVMTDNGVFFMKKYAKNRGYLLNSKDILQLCWEQNIA